MIFDIFLYNLYRKLCLLILTLKSGYFFEERSYPFLNGFKINLTFQIEKLNVAADNHMFCQYLVFSGEYHCFSSEAASMRARANKP